MTTRRAVVLGCVVVVVAACALSLEVSLTPVVAPGSVAALRDEAREALRGVGLPADGRLELDDVIDLMNRLTPAQEPARGPLSRLRRRLERRDR